MMKLAVLETGRPPEALVGRFGTYPEMYRRMLGLAELPSYDVAAGVLPERPEDHDAYIVSGSPAGVYDPLPWTGQLFGFLREAKGRAKLVGICFGHQAMAQALGGSVAKSHKGWGVGLHDYSVVDRQPWMDGETAVSIPASHQDQVIAQPPGSVVTMASPFTPFAGLAWGDQAISFQFHPEFEPDYAKALVEVRRERLDDADAALASLDRPTDNARVARWIGRFLKG